MARGFQGAMLRGFGARDHTATFLETARIAAHFVRIRMQSPTLFCDAQAEPAAWLRFWFPDPEGSTTWARAAEPGATIAVMSLMGSLRLDIPDEHPAGYLLIGDAAAMASTAAPLAVLAYVATNSGWQQRRRLADPCGPRITVRSATPAGMLRQPLIRHASAKRGAQIAP